MYRGFFYGFCRNCGSFRYRSCSNYNSQTFSTVGGNFCLATKVNIALIFLRGPQLRCVANRNNPPVPGGELPTSRSMIFVAPDGERSMNTYLGISSELGPDDVSDSVAGSAEILFLEGYLYDKPKGKQAFERAVELCHKAGGKAGIALSDPFCVDRHRDSFRTLVKSLDYVIGNEHEWSSLYQTDLSAALEQADLRLVFPLFQVADAAPADDAALLVEDDGVENYQAQLTVAQAKQYLDSPPVAGRHRLLVSPRAPGPLVPVATNLSSTLHAKNE